MRLFILGLALLLAAGRAHAGDGDLDPFAHLKPGTRAGLEAPPGAGKLEDLPTYEIDQALDDASGTFRGRLRLRYTNTTGAPLRELPLLLHPNASEELGVAGASGSIAVDEVKVEAGSALEDPTKTGLSPVPFSRPRPTILLVHLGEGPREPLAPGARVTLHVSYGGRLRVLPPDANDPFGQALASMGALAGAGAADYGLVAIGDGIATLASAYPAVAPFRDGAFDVSRPARHGDVAYNSVAVFRVRTVVPAGLRVVTNLVDAPPDALPPGAGGGAVVVRSAGALVRDLVLVAGRDLARESVVVGSTRVTSIFRPRDAMGGKRSLEAAAAALATYERRFGPYPYVELDVAEASLVGGAGGVEFSSLVLVAGMLYRRTADSRSPLALHMKLLGGLADELFSGLDGKRAKEEKKDEEPDLPLAEALDFTVAHEVAHQYFAGIVGNDSRRFPSLDEPLAQYAAGLAIEEWRGKAAGRRALDANVKLNYAIYRLLGGRDAPVLRSVSTFRTTAEYAGLVYGKAPYLYVRLRESLGDERLDAAIRAAIARHRFALATPDGFLAALEEAAGGPESGVRAAAARFLEEAHGDEDLGVDGSGDFVLETLFPGDVAATLRDSCAMLGLEPADLLRSLLGGGVPEDAPPGPGIDPEEALRRLEGR